LVEDRETGLGRVLVDRAARLGGGQAKHVVEILDQAAEEQLADLLDGERRGFRVGAALGDVRVQELQRRLLVAQVGERVLADVHGDREQRDVVLLVVPGRQVAGRVDDESDTHCGFPGAPCAPLGERYLKGGWVASGYVRKAQKRPSSAPSGHLLPASGEKGMRCGFALRRPSSAPSGHLLPAGGEKGGVAAACPARGWRP